MGQWSNIENGISRCRATLDSITVTPIPAGVVLRVVQSGAEVAELRLDAGQAAHLARLLASAK